MSDTIRAAFEAWDCQEFCIDVEHYKQVNGVYVDAPIRNRWLTWQAAQSQPAPPSQPSNATWKTVPSEPDKLMLVKGENALHSSSHGDFHATEGEIEACYLAMLEAAPAPPVPASVQEIMPLVNAYVRACGEFLISGDDSADEALKPLQAALVALVDDNHRLKFELDGVRAMRGPLTEAEVTAIHSLPYVRACLMEYRHWPVDETASAVVKAIAVQISALAASPYTNGIEPEQGEVK